MFELIVVCKCVKVYCKGGESESVVCREFCRKIGLGVRGSYFGLYRFEVIFGLEVSG